MQLHIGHWITDRFLEVRLDVAAAFITELSCNSSKRIGMLFSFDGASRGNPGPSSYGVCAWWGYFRSGAFESMGLLLNKGARTGTSTNNISEAHGLASMVKVCLRYHCLVIEQLSQLARHTTRDK